MMVYSLKDLRTQQPIFCFRMEFQEFPFSLSLVKDSHLCVILGYRREIDENCDILDYHARSSGSLLPTFRDNHVL